MNPCGTPFHIRKFCNVWKCGECTGLTFKSNLVVVCNVSTNFWYKSILQICSALIILTDRTMHFTPCIYVSVTDTHNVCIYHTLTIPGCPPPANLAIWSQSLQETATRSEEIRTTRSTSITPQFFTLERVHPWQEEHRYVRRCGLAFGISLPACEQPRKKYHYQEITETVGR